MRVNVFWVLFWEVQKFNASGKRENYGKSQDSRNCLIQVVLHQVCLDFLDKFNLGVQFGTLYFLGPLI